MKILYLDTSSNFLYAGIRDNDCLVDTIIKKLDKDLSSMALLEISKMLEKNNFKPNDIDKIIVVNGPGSFTGVRIGVTIAKIFAWSLSKEITTISSLEAMACSIEEGDYIISAIDARRNFVFAGIYDLDGNCVMKNQYISMDAINVAADNLPGKVAFISNDILKTNFKVYDYIPNIEKIIKIYASKETINPHAVEPEYLKLTEAEENGLLNDRSA